MVGSDQIGSEPHGKRDLYWAALYLSFMDSLSLTSMAQKPGKHGGLLRNLVCYSFRDDGFSQWFQLAFVDGFSWSTTPRRERGEGPMALRIEDSSLLLRFSHHQRNIANLEGQL